MGEKAEVMGSKHGNLVLRNIKQCEEPITMLDHTIAILTTICQGLPIGTNLAMLYFLWALISGALLPNRGAIIPALKSIGLSDEEVRRSWAAFGSGVWSINELCSELGRYVRKLPAWQERRYEGYLPITVDITAYWRPALKDCPGVHFHPAAQCALPAINIGLLGEVGEVNGQRLALLRRIERANGTDVSEPFLWKTLLPRVAKELKSDEIAVIDAGVKIGAVQKSDIPRYVLKQAQNVTARRNFLPEHVLGRKPEYGEIVRPVGRTRKGKTLPASMPDETCRLTKDGREIRVEIWRALVRTDQKPSPDNKAFDIYVFHDPKYKTPWVLATPLNLKAKSVYQIYSDRWPVEQVPLSSKQMLGAHRQFVHNPECSQRLPEITLLAGSILSFLAASFPPVPTGFWDKNPKRTPGRFRRQLMGKPFPRVIELPRRFREKLSCTAHLLKGNLARTPKVAQKAGP